MTLHNLFTSKIPMSDTIRDMSIAQPPTSVVVPGSTWIVINAYCYIIVRKRTLLYWQHRTLPPYNGCSFVYKCILFCFSDYWKQSNHRHPTEYRNMSIKVTGYERTWTDRVQLAYALGAHLTLQRMTVR